MTPKQSAPDRVTSLLHLVAGIALVAMMLVVVGDVVLRAAFNTPIIGAYDVVSIALLVMTMFGIAPVVARRGEILIDLIDAVVPASGVTILSRVSTLAGIAVFLFFGWSMVQPAIDAWQWGERSLELGLPKWPLWVVAFFGLIGILFAYLVQFRSPVGAPSGDATKDGGA